MECLADGVQFPGVTLGNPSTSLVGAITISIVHLMKLWCRKMKNAVQGIQLAGDGSGINQALFTNVCPWELPPPPMPLPPWKKVSFKRNMWVNESQSWI